jgi:hypothetical protein
MKDPGESTGAFDVGRFLPPKGQMRKTLRHMYRIWTELRKVNGVGRGDRAPDA